MKENLQEIQGKTWIPFLCLKWGTPEKSPQGLKYKKAKALKLFSHFIDTLPSLRIFFSNLIDNISIKRPLLTRCTQYAHIPDWRVKMNQNRHFVSRFT